CIREHGLEYRLEFARRAGDNLEHLRRRCLLLQRLGQIIGALAQFVEQSRVLNGDDGLRREVRQQLGLLVGEWQHLLAVYGDHADQFIFLEHWHAQIRANAALLDSGNAQRITFGVGSISRNISNMHDLLRLGGAAEAGSSARVEYRFTHPSLYIGWWRAIHGDSAESISFTQIHGAELGCADTRRILQHGLEHRLQLAGRTADNLQHLRGRGLLLQRFTEVVGALTQLVKEPRILDGDDGLGGEVLDQLDLLVGEWAHLLAIHANRANEFTFLKHWHYRIGPYACDFDKVNHPVVFCDVGLVGPNVWDVDYLFGLGEAVERHPRIIAQVDHRPAP